MKKLLFTLGALALGIIAINAQKPAVVVNDKSGWHKIGETTVDFEKDNDEVAVLIADRFAALKFKVTDAPIELLDIDVYFTEGDKQNIRIGYAVKKEGDNSREIDLKGGSERSIKKIAFRYKTIENRKDKKAHVEIWGRKTNTVKSNGSAAAADDKSAMKQETREAKDDMKQEGREMKKEAKEESKEAKHDTKKAMNKADKKMDKEAKEAKKEAKEAKEDIKND